MFDTAGTRWSVAAFDAAGICLTCYQPRAEHIGYVWCWLDCSDCIRNAKIAYEARVRASA